MFTTSAFDFYQASQSPIHRLDPRVKLIAAIGLVFSNVLLPDGAWVVFGLAFAIMIALAYISRIGPGFMLKRALIALPFALVAFTVMFTLPGKTLTEFNLFSWHLTITIPGLVRFISIVIRAWLSVQAAILLTATTKFPDLAHGLRHLHIPLVLIAIISFMYRYLFVLSEEAERLLQARTARSAVLPGSKRPSVFWLAKNAGNMVGQLFLRSYERSDRVYNAMVARGFKGEFLTFTPHRMQPIDWLTLVSFLLLLSLLQLIANII